MVGPQSAAMDLHPLDPGGPYAIAKLQKESGRGQNVTLDSAATPGTTIHCDGKRSRALAVEPPTGDGVEILTDKADGVGRVLGQHNHPIAVVQIAFMNGFQLLAVIDNRPEGSGCYSRVQAIIAD